MISLSSVVLSSKGELLASEGDRIEYDLGQLAMGLCNDTREDCKGKVYVAITGPNFDGHHYLKKAEQAGAIAVVVESDSVDSMSIPVIKVENSIEAMGLIAAKWRKNSSALVLGITGSVGKTSLKEMASSVFSGSVKGIATVGNLNNEIGVPLTLSRLCAEDEYAVIEMGMSGFGEIRYLSQITQPNVVVINNAAPAHLEGLGTVEGVANAKAEIIEGLNDEGVVVLNADDTYFELWKSKSEGKRVVSFGLTNSADISASYRTESDSTVMQVVGMAGDFELKLPLLGEHNVRNALAVIAATSQMGSSTTDIKKGLESYTPLSSRGGERKLKNALIINDTYNANPVSMRASIQTLELRAALLRSKGKDVKTYIVLGDMGELGEGANEMHADIGATAEVDYLLCVGELSQSYILGFSQKVEGSGVAMHFQTKEELAKRLGALLKEQAGVYQQLVLVKGSRSARMEEVIELVFNKK